MNAIDLVEALVELGIEVAEVSPQVTASVRTALILLKSGDAPTFEQQTQIDEALAATHEALQDALTTKLK